MSSISLSASSTSLQQQAIERARSAYTELKAQCTDLALGATGEDVVSEMIKILKQKSELRRKRRTIAQKFEQYTQWLQNFSGIVDVVVQTQAGIGCPVWAPIKLALQVGPHGPRAMGQSASLVQNRSEQFSEIE